MSHQCVWLSDVQLAELTERLEEILAADPEAFGDGESIRTLHRYRARLDAWLAKATATFDASAEWRTSGAQTAAAWLAVEAGLPKSEARRAVRLGRALRHLPAAEEAWCAGAIGAAHVDALHGVANACRDEALRRDEAELVEHAKELRFADFVKLLAYWAQQVDPDGAECRAALQRDRRDAYLAESFGGMWLGRLNFDPVSGAIVGNELRRLTDELFQADWAEAKARLGRDPVSDELSRTPAQRRSDAFVEMATRSAAMPPEARRPAPLVSFLVDFELRHRMCELAQGAVLTPGSILRHLTVADFERIVMAPPNRVEVSEKARFFTGAQRRKIEVLHGICQHPYCDRPAVECQVDHIVPYSAGGLTTVENGRLLCEFHNRLEYLKWLEAQDPRPPPQVA
jgi:hypothetical protein